VPVLQHARSYWPYLVTLLVGLMLIICIPELSLFLPRSAGLTK
jgi:TRAP-type C4-dicarboxylate transport system permease large subunit